jgi:hypothetical protein
MKENEAGRICATYGEKTSCGEVLDRKIPLGRQRRRWRIILKRDLKI